MMASDQFQRSGAIIGGVTQSQVSKILVQFSKAVNKILRPDVLHLPTEERMKKNEKILHDKYNLPGFAFGVNGVLVNFDGMPQAYQNSIQLNPTLVESIDMQLMLW